VALPGLFDHSFANFLAKVVDVVLRHQDLDAVHEFLGRSGILREDDVLLDEVHFDTELVDRDPVFDIAVQAVSLLDQQDPTRRRLLAQECDHLAE
jgi:hypothetical protein